ncbi:uncharacterized protein [Typha angustifolia]|uniref:uncharacterized protein n=1 Tax=Typha angustifolia TaxID=59011 RepID=UPI003C2C490C
MAKGGVIAVIDADETTTTSSRRTPLLSHKESVYTRCLSHADDELKSFRSCLRYLCVDQSDLPHAVASWSLFVFLAILVPLFAHLFFVHHRRPYDSVVQLSLSSASSLSFISLSAFVRRFGLRRFLFLDRLRRDSERVQLGYTAQLSRSFRILSFFVLPCFSLDAIYKLFWFYEVFLSSHSASRLPLAAAAATCLLELASWIYRTAIFFLVCVLFRLICHLQILRMEDFVGAFNDETDVAAVLKEHLRIRRQLSIISHRYRAFIISCLVLVTISQFATLLLTTRPHAQVNFFTAGELVLCSIGLVTGILICLRSAAKITHKTQAITSHAATWHVCATVESFNADAEDPSVSEPPTNNSSDDTDEDEDDLDDRKLMSSTVNTISYHKRQALVTYLENNRAGITVFGFVVDRTWLHALFMIEFSLVMWLLGKTVGIS